MEESFNAALDVLATHGYWIVFLWMFADQAALPVPAVPLLIAAGVVAATGGLDLTWIVVAASVASLLADLLWYWLGARGGGKALSGSGGFGLPWSRFCTSR